MSWGQIVPKENSFRSELLFHTQHVELHVGSVENKTALFMLEASGSIQHHYKEISTMSHFTHSSLNDTICVISSQCCLQKYRVNWRRLLFSNPVLQSLSVLSLQSSWTLSEFGQISKGLTRKACQCWSTGVRTGNSGGWWGGVGQGQVVPEKRPLGVTMATLQAPLPMDTVARLSRTHFVPQCCDTPKPEEQIWLVL